MSRSWHWSTPRLTLGDKLVDMEAKTLVDTFYDNLKAEAPVDTVSDTLAETEAETIGDTLIDV